MLLRIAKPLDEAGIRLCAEDAYEQYVATIGKKPAPMIADFGEQISRGLIHVAINERNEVDGFIVFFPRDNHMFLENVAVRASRNGKGIGKALMALCEREAGQIGLTTIQLYTNEKMTNNLTMYPHLGYREIGRREEDGFNRVYFEKKLAPIS